MSFSTAVIVGSTGGLGAAIAKRLLQLNPNMQLAALSRDGSGVPNLDAALIGNVIPVKCDITDESSIENASQIVKSSFGNSIELVWNCAGILSRNTEGQQIKPEKSITWVKPESLETVFRINTFGVAYLGKHFLPIMKATKTRNPKVFASLSARVGSIEENKIGGWMSYRASKSASNAMLQVMAIEHAQNNIACVALQPGTVATALSAPFRAATAPGVFTAEYSAEKLVEVVSQLEPSQRASFLDYKGESIPW